MKFHGNCNEAEMGIDLKTAVLTLGQDGKLSTVTVQIRRSTAHDTKDTHRPALILQDS